MYDSAYKGWNEKILDTTYEYAAVRSDSTLI